MQPRKKRWVSVGPTPGRHPSQYPQPTAPAESQCSTAAPSRRAARPGYRTHRLARGAATASAPTRQMPTAQINRRGRPAERPVRLVRVYHRRRLLHGPRRDGVPPRLEAAAQQRQPPVRLTPKRPRSVLFHGRGSSIQPRRPRARALAPPCTSCKRVRRRARRSPPTLSPPLRGARPKRGSGGGCRRRLRRCCRLFRRAQRWPPSPPRPRTLATYTGAHAHDRRQPPPPPPPCQRATTR